MQQADSARVDNHDHIFVMRSQKERVSISCIDKTLSWVPLLADEAFALNGVHHLADRAVRMLETGLELWIIVAQSHFLVSMLLTDLGVNEHVLVHGFDHSVGRIRTDQLEGKLENFVVLEKMLLLIIPKFLKPLQAQIKKPNNKYFIINKNIFLFKHFLFRNYKMLTVSNKMI